MASRPTSTETTGAPDWGAPISMRDAADLLGVTVERVGQLVRSGHIERIGRGKTTTRSAVQGYAAFLKESSDRATRTSAQERVAAARAAEIEQRTAVRNRELIPIEESLQAMQILVGIVVSEAETVPARVTRDMALRRKIEDAIRDMRSRIAAALRDQRTVIKSGKSE